MTRIKPKNSIKNKEQAEATLAEINKIDMQLAQWDMAEAEAIYKVRETYAQIYKKEGRIGLEAEKTLLIKELEAWAEVDSATWEKKTYETQFGNMGFRISTPAVVLIKKIARSFKEAIVLVEARMPEFIRKEPALDKEAILAAEREGSLDKTKLERCGLAVEQKEEFWVETAASADLDEASRSVMDPFDWSDCEGEEVFIYGRGKGNKDFYWQKHRQCED